MNPIVKGNVSEGAPPHTLVTRVKATDEDDSRNDATIVYSLVGSEGRGIFYIDHAGMY